MDNWQYLLKKLQTFKQLYGHCRVPYPWLTDPVLSEWTVQIRTMPEGLPQAIYEDLHRLGVDLEHHPDPDWLTFYEQLRLCITPYSTLQVSEKTEAYPDLAIWVNQQQEAKAVLTPQQVQLLDQLHFDWGQESWQDKYWQMMYQQLVDFHQQHGHCRIPASWQENKSLAKWVFRQRHAELTMSPERKKQLDAIGFLWKKDLEELDQAVWNRKYAQLQAFVAEHGHFQVPIGNAAFRTLRIWVDAQRKNQDLISARRKEQLDAIGFPWKEDISQSVQQAWQAMYQKLVDFHATHGHSRVPSKWKQDPGLAGWVSRQRSREKKLPAKNKALLNKLDFPWHSKIKSSKNKKWTEMFEQLQLFHQQKGHCRVPDQYEENPGLGKWVSWQRKREWEGKLPSNYKQLLNTLGFTWKTDIERENRLRWERLFIRLKRFRQKNGHCRVPENWPKDKELAIWVGMLRQNEKQLSFDWRFRLKEVGFAWQIDLKEEREEIWEQMFQQLLVFQQEHGHNRITINHPNQKLFRWVAKQRRIQHKLPAHRLEKLNSIQFSWTADTMKNKNQKWQDKFDQLVAFKQRFGHCQVPDQWPENKSLANWVSFQRQQAKKGSLPPDRMEKLTAIGFVFNPLIPKDKVADKAAR